MRTNKLLQTIKIAAAAAVLAFMPFTACDGFFGPVGPPSGIHFNHAISYGSFTDPRDGRSYRTVRIGNQTWMAENLNYSAGGSACYNNLASNCNTYGRLYDWATAMDLSSSCNSNRCNNQITSRHRGICPVGWHVPSDAEWTTLTAGRKLKSKNGWHNNGNGTDDYGFSALPGGNRWSGSFYGVGYRGSWWSATEYDASRAWYRGMDYNNDYVSRFNFYKTGLFSLRCLQD